MNYWAFRVSLNSVADFSGSINVMKVDNILVFSDVLFTNKIEVGQKYDIDQIYELRKDTLRDHKFC